MTTSRSTTNIQVTSMDKHARHENIKATNHIDRKVEKVVLIWIGHLDIDLLPLKPLFFQPARDGWIDGWMLGCLVD